MTSIVKAGPFVPAMYPIPLVISWFSPDGSHQDVEVRDDRGLMAALGLMAARGWKDVFVVNVAPIGAERWMEALCAEMGGWPWC